jgi:hypothetical protein
MPFDPTEFDDPLATEIKWTPIESGGANFRTYKFFSKGANKAGFKSTFRIKLLGFTIMIIGLFLGAGIPIVQYINGDPLKIWQAIILIVAGLGFFSGGVLMLRSYSQYLVFNKKVGCFWKGALEHQSTEKIEKEKVSIKLDEIYALQIIPEYIKDKDGSFTSYELNLVTENGKRHHLIDHGDRTDMIADANKLSDFLGIPVWDAT